MVQLHSRVQPTISMSNQIKDRLVIIKELLGSRLPGVVGIRMGPPGLQNSWACFYMTIVCQGEAVSRRRRRRGLGIRGGQHRLVLAIPVRNRRDPNRSESFQRYTRLEIILPTWVCLMDITVVTFKSHMQNLGNFLNRLRTTCLWCDLLNHIEIHPLR